MKPKLSKRLKSAKAEELTVHLAKKESRKRALCQYAFHDELHGSFTARLCAKCSAKTTEPKFMWKVKPVV